MKKVVLTAMTFAALLSMPVFTSCSDDDAPNGGSGESGQVVTEELSGTVEGVMKLDAKKEYKLTGTLTVPAGATLEIPAGTVIRAQKGFDKYVIVAQGGKIEAKGTAEKPIVFTVDDESKATAGYWGGLILNGKAPLSGTAGQVTVASAEVDNNQKYGGDKADDNSGTLQYVKLLYTGARSSAEIEHNGLTLNGVGNGTTIDHIYVAEGADDAIEFFGGTVNVDNLLAVNCDDDMFDFTQGYSGKLSNCYGRWKKAFTSTEEDPRGVEADGNLDGKGADHTPQSNFVIENMTIENLSESAEMQDAIKIRRGATATVKNALVKGTGKVTDLIDFTDKKGAGQAGDAFSVTSELTTALSGEEVNGDGNVSVTAGNKGCTSDFTWTGYQL